MRAPLLRSQSKCFARAAPSTSAARRRLSEFPPPWSSVEEQEACFTVRDANGKVLAHVHFEDTSAIRSMSRCERLFCS